MTYIDFSLQPSLAFLKLEIPITLCKTWKIILNTCADYITIDSTFPNASLFLFSNVKTIELQFNKSSHF